MESATHLKPKGWVEIKPSSYQDQPSILIKGKIGWVTVEGGAVNPGVVREAYQNARKFIDRIFKMAEYVRRKAEIPKSDVTRIVVNCHKDVVCAVDVISENRGLRFRLHKLADGRVELREVFNTSAGGFWQLMRNSRIVEVYNDIPLAEVPIFKEDQYKLSGPTINDIKNTRIGTQKKTPSSFHYPQLGPIGGSRKASGIRGTLEVYLRQRRSGQYQQLAGSSRIGGVPVQITIDIDGMKKISPNLKDGIKRAEEIFSLFLNVLLEVLDEDTEIEEIRAEITRTLAWVHVRTTSEKYKAETPIARWQPQLYRTIKVAGNRSKEQKHRIDIDMPVSVPKERVAIKLKLSPGPNPPLAFQSPFSDVPNTPRDFRVLGFPRELLSRYEPLEFLGEGGFAKVFKARRKSDGEIVALKIPRIDEKTSSLFIKEAAAWYNLNHENIVRLYKADILPVPYLEMEFIEGVELDGKIIRDLDKYPKPVDEGTALKIITGIAEGLKHAHSKGIYHLDLKPLNVLLKSDLTPKITDWGLAKISARNSLSQHYGYSPLYASPEQLDEATYGSPDHRTDIYHLGLILYELLTGELPYSATTPGALIGKILHGTPKKPSEINPALAKYDGIFEKLLAKKKEDRFSNVEEFLEALKSLGELEREKEELKKTTVAMRKSRSREEFERLKVESVRKTIKIALLSARLNDKAELLRALDDLRFETRENFDDLVSAIEQVELLLREGIPIGNETFEMLRALLLRIEGEVVR